MNSENFNLKSFIQKSSNLLPKHLKSLYQSGNLHKEVEVQKKIILLFLKEYIKHSKDKFSRKQFNIGFVKDFIYKIFPKDGSKYSEVSTLRVQNVILNFINFLTMKKVLKRNTETKLLKELEKTDQTKENTVYKRDKEIRDYYKRKIEEKNLDIILKQYSDQLTELIEKLIKNSEILNSYPKEQIYSTILLFAEDMFCYFQQTYETWDADALEFIFLKIYPRCFCGTREESEGLTTILTTFFTYLGKAGIISEEHANSLSLRLYSINERMIEDINDPTLWDIRKAQVMEAINSGIDINDKAKLEEFLHSKKREYIAKIFTSSYMEKEKEIERSSTEELIQNLRKIGIPFMEEKFLENLTQFYSIEELTNYWIEKFNLEQDFEILDDVWLITMELHKRLAPDTLTCEKIFYSMMEGYDLLKEEKFKEVCDTWLETWEYIKKLFGSDFDSIEDLENIFEGYESVIIWTYDFSIGLINMGLSDKNYFHKRITFCKEILELFPESDKFFIQNVMKNLGESYFYLDMEEEGEKIFKRLIEMFPKYTWGYIGWADYYLGLYSDQFDYTKAKSIFDLALKRCTEDLEDLRERISMLKDKKIGVDMKESLLSDYKSILSKKKLSKRNKEKKISDAIQFLDYVIFTKKLMCPEDIAEKFDPDIVLSFLGIWVIQKEIVTTMTSIIGMCRNIKSFLRFFMDHMKFHEEEKKEIRQICNSKKFFITRFESFQKRNLKQLLDQQNFKVFDRWKSDNTKWYSWMRRKKVEAERKEKK